jgi:hypothetical protein
MALSGLHVVCASSGQPRDQGASQPILSVPEWSETLASAGTTGQMAPRNGSVFHIIVSADSYVAFGSTPDASKAVSTDKSSARVLIRATDPPFDLYVKGGDKLAWLAA